MVIIQAPISFESNGKMKKAGKKVPREPNEKLRKRRFENFAPLILSKKGGSFLDRIKM